MNLSNLKKSLLNYAIEGNLSAKFRRENPTLNALKELEAYNQKIKLLKSQREQWKKNLEKLEKKTGDLTQKQRVKSLLAKLKKRISTYQIVTPIDDDEIPFEIPQSWVWVKLGDICKINPKNNIKDSLSVSFIPMALISDSFKNIFSSETRKWGDIKKNFTHLMNNAIAFAKITPCFQNQKSIILKDLKNEYGAGTTELIVLLPHDNKILNYLYFLVNSPYFIQSGEREMTGTAGQQRVPTEFVKNFIIPLPPLEEQRFICGEIEKLLSHTQDFEFKAQQLQNLENNLSSFMDKSLLNYTIEGNLSAKFRRENPTLNALKELEAYNQKIKLLKSQREQWKKNLEKLEKKTGDLTQKQRVKSLLAKLKKRISTYQIVTPIDDDEIPFEIPQSWVWVKLGDMGIWKSGTTPSRDKASYYSNGTIPWLKTGDLNDGYIFSTSEQITQLAFNECNLTLIPQESVLIAMYGATIGKLGIAKIPLTTNQACCACRCKPFITPLFLFYFLMQNKSNFISLGFGSGQPNISKEKIESSLIPLPPLEEQRFICGEIEKLLTLCSQIK